MTSPICLITFDPYHGVESASIALIRKQQIVIFWKQFKLFVCFNLQKSPQISPITKLPPQHIKSPPGGAFTHVEDPCTKQTKACLTCMCLSRQKVHAGFNAIGSVPCRPKKLKCANWVYLTRWVYLIRIFTLCSCNWCISKGNCSSTK